MNYAINSFNYFYLYYKINLLLQVNDWINLMLKKGWTFFLMIERG